MVSPCGMIPIDALLQPLGSRSGNYSRIGSTSFTTLGQMFAWSMGGALESRIESSVRQK